MTSHALALPSFTLPAGPFRPLPAPTIFPAYARACHEQPVLDEREERDLVTRLHRHADRDAAWRLILSHLRLVVRVVRAHAGYGLPPGDLAQEGTVGLMKAVRRFNPDRGVRLASYALRWIEAEVREFIFRNWRLVRLTGTTALRRLFFGYRKTVAALRQWGEERAHPAGWSTDIKAIAAALEVGEDDVRTAEAYFRGTDEGLERPALDGEFEDAHEEARALPAVVGWSSSGEDPAVAFEADDEDARRRAWLAGAFARLPERERLVLTARRLQSPPEGLKELGQRLGISAERVRQIEARAWQRLTSSLPVEGQAVERQAVEG